MIRALALLCARNEELHVGAAIAGLIAEGLDVVLLDHQSGDATHAIAAAYRGRGLLAIHDLPWRGAFSLTEQLQAKQALLDQFDHDWVVHVDADEWPMSRDPGRRLIDEFAQATRDGANCFEFDEFCFVPLGNEDFAHPGHRLEMRRYYHFIRRHSGLMRAFRRDGGFDFVQGAGHVLRGGEVRLAPARLVLRHYIALSHAQACAKYVGRRFAADETAKGWHFNRLGLTAEQLMVRPHPALRQLPEPLSGAFDRSAPVTEHFWHW